MSFRSAAARSHATLRNQRLLEIGATAKLDGEDDAGEHGGGAHDVLGDMACDRRGDGTADDAAQAHGDGERPVDGATADEHDRGGDVRAEADHGFQRVDLVERADFAQVEDGQGERAGGGAEIAGIHADETHARPQPPWIVAQCAVRRFAGDSCGPLTLMRLRQRLRHGVARGGFLTWVERDDKRAEQDERRHGEFEDLRRQFEQQQAADDAADQADARVDGHASALAFELLAGGEQRPYTPRPRFNNGEGGEQRSYTPRPRTGGYNQGGDRPYRPRTGGYNQGGDRPYRPRTGGYNQGGGYNRPYRPRTADYNPNAKYSLKKQIEYKDILTDPNEPIRLNKFLANAGICSRREADEFITAGVVSVNGEVVTELGTKIKRTDEVKFHDEPVSIERKTYILLNKPKDCVTTSDDPQERKTVMDFVKGACKERIYPVGRLDRNTTGVLLLTNDGDLASKLTHPKYLKKKIYHVYCDKNVTKADLDQIAAGVTLDDGEIHADAISYASETDKSQVGIEIHSGKNRIVRRIFESLGYKVIKLDRVYFAGLTKKGLRRGDWRYLTEQEVNMLRMGSFE